MQKKREKTHSVPFFCFATVMGLYVRVEGEEVVGGRVYKWGEKRPMCCACLCLSTAELVYTLPECMCFFFCCYCFFFFAHVRGARGVAVGREGRAEGDGRREGTLDAVS